MRQIMYVSEAKDGLTLADIDEILDVARAANAAAGITGVLLFADDAFVQIIEGDDAPLDALLTRLKADARHTNLQILMDERVAEREFADWRMAFGALSPESAGDLHGATRKSAHADADRAIAAELSVLIRSYCQAQPDRLATA